MAKIKKPKRVKQPQYTNVPELIQEAYKLKEIIDDNRAWQGIIRSASPQQKARYKADGIDLGYYRQQAGQMSYEIRILHKDIKKALGGKAYKQLGLGKMPHSRYQLYHDDPKDPRGYRESSYLKTKK